MEMDNRFPNIKLFMTYSPNRHDRIFRHPLFYPVLAGSIFQEESASKRFLRDNTGDNISQKNPYYCELTTQYWVWKNVDADYYGFCHYRRLFSFADTDFMESDAGVVVRRAMNGKVFNELALQADSIQSKIGRYDFIIAKGIPIVALQARDLVDHYSRGKGLHVEDLGLMMEVIKKQYPEIYPLAREYMNGKVFYPCNMFVAKKEIFFEYCRFLFSILNEVEQNLRMENYSAEGVRTLGHLGERLLGIYYLYLKKRTDYRLDERQVVLLEDTKPSVRPRKEADNEVTVVMAANEAFVPVLSVAIRSLRLCADRERDYHIYILHSSICEKSQKALKDELEQPHFQLTFLNVSAYMIGYSLKTKSHISAETYYRFLVPELFKNYEKVLYLDCDVIVHEDVAHIYDVQLQDNLIGAVKDVDFIGQYNGANPDTRNYCDTVLKLTKPLEYFQAGVLLINVPLFRETVSMKKLWKMAGNAEYKFSDQDILNVICAGRICFFSIRWNLLTDSRQRINCVISEAPKRILDEYMEARQSPAVIHYAGADKPWKNPGEDFAKEFWGIARKSIYYEELIYRFLGNYHGRQKVTQRIITNSRNIAKTVLPEGSWIRRQVGTLYWKWK